MQVDIEISAPATRVWHVITDLDSTPDRLTAVESVERLDGGGPISVGTRWRETRRMFGRAATEEMEIIAVDAPRSYTIGAEGGGAVYRTVMAVEPMDEARTRLSMRFDATPTGRVAAVAGRLMAPLVSRSMRRALQQDLHDIRRAAEETAAR